MRSVSCERATAWRVAWWGGGDGPIDLLRAVASAGWYVDVRPLRAQQGGLEACLLTSPTSGFHIVVDPWSDPVDPERLPATGVLNPVARFRLAHEIGHTFFYTATTPPSRPDRPTPREEEMCDLFAAALLVPPHVAAKAIAGGPTKTRDTAVRYQAPLDALRASAELFGGPREARPDAA